MDTFARECSEASPNQQQQSLYMWDIGGHCKQNLWVRGNQSVMCNICTCFFFSFRVMTCFKKSINGGTCRHLFCIVHVQFLWCFFVIQKRKCRSQIIHHSTLTNRKRMMSRLILLFHFRICYSNNLMLYYNLVHLIKYISMY